MSDDRSSEALRQMVREVLREVLPKDADRSQSTGRPPAPVPAAPRSAPPPDVRRIRIRDDRDVADLVTQVLNLATDPARAADLRSGRIRFALASDGPGPTVPADTPLEVDRGAVTERVIQRAAREQRPLRIGPRAVLTPLARDRARALGVTIHRTTPENR